MANTNFTPWLGNEKVDNIQSAYDPTAFQDGEAIVAKRFNAALRMSSLVAAAIIDALNIGNDIGIEQSLTTISGAVKTGLASIKVNNAIHATSADTATSATSAGHATSADTATSATSAGHATSADTATSAESANSATTSSFLDVVARNEIRFKRPSDWVGKKSLNIGYRWAGEGETDNLIKEYIFQNGNADLTDIKFKSATGNLNGNADTATASDKIKIGTTAYTLSLSGTTLTLTAD